MLSYYKAILILNIVLGHGISIYGQKNIPPNDHIGAANGLTGNIITSVLEDTLGNLWLVSPEEISVYDGYKMKVLNSNNSALKPWIINGIYKDNTGYIWVSQLNIDPKKKWYNVESATNCHITIFNPLTFEEIPLHNFTNDDQVSNQDIIIKSIINDSFRIVTKTGDLYTLTDSLVLTLSDVNIEDYRWTDLASNHYFLHGDTLRIINPMSDTIAVDLSECNPTSRICNSPYNPFPFSVYIEFTDPDSMYLYKLTQAGIEKEYTIGNSTSQKQTFKIIDRRPLRWNGSDFIISNGKLIDNQTGNNFISIYNIASDRYLHQGLVSQTGLIYLSSNLGVYVLKKNVSEFKFWAYNTSPMNSVRAVWADNDIMCYKDWDQERIISPSDKYDLSFLDDHFLGKLATCHLRDPLDKNILWSTGHLSHDYRKIDLVKKQVTLKSLPYPGILNGVTRSPYSDKIYLYGMPGLFVSSDSDMFVPVECYYDIFNGEQIAVNHILAHLGLLFLGTNKGLFVYDETNDQINLSQVISQNIIEQVDYIHIDNDEPNVLWLATVRDGVIRYDLNTHLKEKISILEGLSHNTPHYIHEDDLGRLWIPTNNGLNCLDKKSRENHEFILDDGLPNSEFNRRSYHYNPVDSTLWLGGLNGYLYFNPNKVKVHFDNRIKLRITSGYLSDNRRTIKDISTQLFDNSEIVFEEKDVALNLSFSTNHIFKTEQTIFSYRILELDDSWQDLSGSELLLNKLPYGNYTLELQADRSKDSRSSDILQVNIIVSLPVYKTSAFAIACACILLFLAYLMHRKRTQIINNRNNLLESEIKHRTKDLEKANEAQLKIFTIIAHDLNNPLAALKDINDKVKFLIGKNRLKDIDLLTEQTNDRINALNDNLSNLLQWAVNETNLSPVTKEKLSVRLEIDKIIKIYTCRINEKNLRLVVNLDAVDQVYMNVAVLQTVLRNVISNAIKFSKDSGAIYIQKVSESASFLSISIKDEGIGMDQSSKTQNGAGIGLMISKELALKSNLCLDFLSNDSGTEVIIQLPIV